MDTVPIFDAQHLESIARVLADTSEGLTGSEIGHILRDCRVHDPDPLMTKWKRLYNAFVGAQNQFHVGNHVVMFINRAMKPVRYTSRPDLFDERRASLNRILAFSGFCVGEDGNILRVSKAASLDEALARADGLHRKLTSRGVHEDVLQFCRAELLQHNYFHAVFEASKSIAAKIRSRTGLTSDGAELARTAFALPKDGNNPMLAINDLRTDTDRGEQRGFTNLLIGFFGTIRNPLAHNPKIEWPMEENDALDILTLASLLHRKLDRAHRH